MTMTPKTRRNFITTSLAAAAGSIALGPYAHATMLPAAQPGATRTPARKGLRILVLGGTGFIGPYVVRHAMERGHTITLFNRGLTNTHLFPDVEKLVGDRGAQIESLKGHDWDVCIDNTGYIGPNVRATAELLRDVVDRYLFTSTRQVFADFTAPDKKEDDPKWPIENPENEALGRGYGANKVVCERIVNEIYGNRATIVRPTAVAGPTDRSDRFTYWPVRINQGGDVLAPGAMTDPIQFIDVRDLAEFMVHLIEEDIPGPFNCAGPQADLSVAELLYGVRAITNADVSFTWVPADFLAEHNVRARREMPLWITPQLTGKTISPVNRDKAIAHGLTFRPLAVTARDTLDWYLSKPKSEQRLRIGISPEREAEVLAAWRAR